MKLDLKHFHKIGHTKIHTALQHKDGHILHIAHKACSPEEVKRLKDLPMKTTKMAKGGSVAPTITKEKPEEEKKLLPGSEKDRKLVQESFNKALGPRASYSEGGSIARQRYAEGTPDQPTSLLDLAKLPEDQRPEPVQNPEAQTIPLTPEQQKSLDQENEKLGMPKPEGIAPEGPEGVRSLKQGLEKGEANILGGIGTEVQAQRREGAQKETELGKSVAELSKTYSKLQEVGQRIQDERKNFNEDLILHTKEDPNRFINSMSMGNKITTAIGMAIGSVGSALTGQPNAALQFLERSIQRDVEAQRNDKENQRSLYAANLKYLGDEQAALKMTEAMQLDAVALRMQQISARAQGPLAQAAAMKALGELQQKAGQAWQEVSNREQLRSIYEGQGQPTQPGQSPTQGLEAQINALRPINPQEAERLEKHLVPGVGLAKKEVPPKQMEELTARASLQQQLNDLRAFARHHEGSLNPAVIREGEALAKQVQDAYRRANGQGVFREAEANFVASVISQKPTAFFNSFRVDPSYKAALKANETELNALKKSYGLPESHQSDEQPVMGKDGKMYVRQGDLMVPVDQRSGR